MGHTKKLIIHCNLLKTLSYANHSPTPPKSSFVNTLAIKIIHLFVFCYIDYTTHKSSLSQVLQENLNTKIYERTQCSTYNPVEYFKRKWMNIIIHWFLFNKKIVSLIRFFFKNIHPSYGWIFILFDISYLRVLMFWSCMRLSWLTLVCDYFTIVN